MSHWRTATGQGWAEAVIRAVRAHGSGVTVIADGEQVYISGRQTERQVRISTYTEVTIDDGFGDLSMVVQSSGATHQHGVMRPQTAPSVGRATPPPPTEPESGARRRTSRKTNAQPRNNSAQPRKTSTKPRGTNAAGQTFGTPEISGAATCLVTGLACLSPARCIGSHCRRG